MANYNLSDQFAEAQGNVNLGRRRQVAQAAHLEVRDVLRRCDELVRKGLDDVLIGSYARDTGIWPGKDVDIFGKLTGESINSILPNDAYQLFLDALSDQYQGRITCQPRSIRVDFGPEGNRAPADQYLKTREASRADLFPFSVDVVPAVKFEVHWGIPSRNRESWQRMAAAERWVRTDPEALTDLTTRLNNGRFVGGQGAFVPTVKALRQIRREHLGDMKPGGLFVELVLHEGFGNGEINGESWADLTASALAYMGRRLLTASSRPICDPALHEPYAPALDATLLASAANIFSQLAGSAKQALTMEKCPAAATWRQIFGANSNGAVFPLPPGCRADGTILVPSVEVNPLRGSNEARGFGIG